MPSDDPWTKELGFTDLDTEERQRAIDHVKSLIRNLDERHPEVFDDEPIDASDYRRELKEAVFSLGGVLRQEHGANNEDTVRDLFLDPAQEQGHLTYEDQRGGERIDFKGCLRRTDENFALDVKGGEGQSIGHLLVPSNTDTLVLWSERNARNTKSPASRLNEVINRAVRWGFNRSRDVAMMVIRDEPAGARTDDWSVIPDVVVFPEKFPSPDHSRPEMRSLDDLHFAEVLYDTMVGTEDLYSDAVQKHLWFHELELVETDTGLEVRKEIYNAYENSIQLQTQSIDYNRVSDVS